jgi:hypothetical protein
LNNLQDPLYQSPTGTSQMPSPYVLPSIIVAIHILAHEVRSHLHSTKRESGLISNTRYSPRRGLDRHSVYVATLLWHFCCPRVRMFESPTELLPYFVLSIHAVLLLCPCGRDDKALRFGLNIRTTEIRSTEPKCHHAMRVCCLMQSSLSGMSNRDKRPMCRTVRHISHHILSKTRSRIYILSRVELTLRYQIG